MLVIERVSEGGGGEVWRGGLFGLGWTSAGFALSCELGLRRVIWGCGWRAMTMTLFEGE